MAGRMLATLAPLALIGGLATPSQPAATTTRYRIESKTEQVIDLSSMGQSNQTTVFTQVAIITVTLSDTTGGLLMHTVIDSITSDAPIMDPSMDPKAAKGSWFHGLIDAWGRTRIVASSAEANPTVMQLRNTLTRFFPVVKPGSKQGDSWVDTSRVESNSAQQSMKTVTTTKYAHGGSETRAGTPATRINATSATTGSGTMENPMAGSMDVELSTTGTETFYLSTDGRYLGGNSTVDGKSEIRMAMAPAPIPVTIKSTATIAVLK